MPKVTGCGEIEEIERGKVYRIRHHLGKDPATGKYIRSPKRTVHGTKSDARRALEEYRRELESGFANPEVTVPELGWRWHEQRNLLKSLSLLNMVYADLREEHGMSQRGVHKLNAVMSQVMGLAVKEHLTEHNPCRDVEVSRPRSAERTPLTLEEAISLCQALHDDELDGRRVAIWLALATGVRRGEALRGLRQHAGVHQVPVHHGQDAARDQEPPVALDRDRRRDGPVPAHLESRPSEVDTGSGPRPDPGHPDVLGQRLRLPRPRQLFSVAEGLFIEHGLGRIEEPEEGRRKRRCYVGYDLHELRHTQATFLIGNGIDSKSVQGRLGHEVSSMTMDVFAHMMGGNGREAADLVGRLLRTGGGRQEAPGEEARANQAAGERAAAAVAPVEPVRLTVVGPDPDLCPCPGAKLVEREVVRDGRAAWVEEWRVTVSSAADLLEIQRGAGAPITIDGSRITVMAKSA